MKRFLTCTAAALLAAPAHALDDDRNLAFQAGASLTSCIHYTEGRISRAAFVQDMIRNQKELKQFYAGMLIRIFEIQMTNPEISPAARRAFKRCYDASKHLLPTPVSYGTTP